MRDEVKSFWRVAVFHSSFNTWGMEGIEKFPKVITSEVTPRDIYPIHYRWHLKYVKGDYAVYWREKKVIYK